MAELKVGVIGLGLRGYSILRDTLLNMPEGDIKVVAVCDLKQERIDRAVALIDEKKGYKPFTTLNYKELIEYPEVEAVLALSAWENHIDAAIYSMKVGKYVGMEVGGAYSIDQCWELVKTYENTGTECMFMENCCYGKAELMATNMARLGVFGKISHCSGGYMHDLRSEIYSGHDGSHYRFRNYLHRNCDNYPTHEIGPIAKLLDINNGNRFVSLVSMASAANGMNEYIKNKPDAPDELKKLDFKQGDIVTTIIKCANGETVTITLDTTLARSYSRGFTVRGTEGGYFGENDMIFLENEHHKYEWGCKPIWGNANQYEEKYIHNIWKNYDASGGHGGMDNLVYGAFVYSVKNKLHPPIDVYDGATYMAITALSSDSIAMGGMPVAFPDFTNGRWCDRHDFVDSPYNLERKI